MKAIQKVKNARDIPEKYATDRQLAERFAVSRATIWRWVQEGHLPRPVKIGGRCTRWAESALAEAGLVQAGGE